MIASSFLWLSYGVLIHEPAVWRTNTCGLFMALFYFVRFIKFAPPRAATLPGSIRQHANGVLTIVFGTIGIIYVLPLKDPSSFVGNIAVILCVAMFASPLAALKTVLQTKSARSIPLPFTIATIINCFLWSVVGLFDIQDFNIYFPNLLGLACGLVQLALKFYYGDEAETRASELEFVI
jgi:solute carrier family 50 protein (sugar transporter)